MNPLPEILQDTIYSQVVFLVEHGLKAPFYAVGNFHDFPDGLHWNTSAGEIIFVQDSIETSTVFIFDQEGFDGRYERPSFQDVLRYERLQ